MAGCGGGGSSSESSSTAGEPGSTTTESTTATGNGGAASETETFPQLYSNGEGPGATEPRQGWVTALDLKNNKTVWQQQFKSGIECVGGSSTTASDLLFVADSSGHLLGYDAKTGKLLWTYSHDGLSIDAPPVVYENEGKEYVAIAATMEGRRRCSASP